MKKKTSILHDAAARDEQTGALSIPVYHASTFYQRDVLIRQPWDYGRSGNPTRGALEEVLAALENAKAGYAFASGMAAITTALTAFTNAGDHIVAAKDIYGGTFRLLTSYLSKFGVTHTFVDTTNPAEVEQAIQPHTKVLFLESPSNPLLKVTDLAQMAEIALKHQLISMIDNTFMTPYLLRPLDFGIDISIHSATKFLAGHSDLIAGAIMTRTVEQGQIVKNIQNTCGNMLSPGDSWLLMRGIKTLSARMDAQCTGAQVLAEWLTHQPWVTEVLYPGLRGHAGHAIMKHQASGFGAVVSIKVDTVERAYQIMKLAKVWNVAVSLGGVESILSYPAKMSHGAVPPLEREKLGITDNLIRLSIGLEDIEDLMDDLAQSAV